MNKLDNYDYIIKYVHSISCSNIPADLLELGSLESPAHVADSDFTAALSDITSVTSVCVVASTLFLSVTNRSWYARKHSLQKKNHMNLIHLYHPCLCLVLCNPQSSMSEHCVAAFVYLLVNMNTTLSAHIVGLSHTASRCQVSLFTALLAGFGPCSTFQNTPMCEWISWGISWLSFIWMSLPAGVVTNQLHCHLK
jgi:hypothetical protein